MSIAELIQALSILDFTISLMLAAVVIVGLICILIALHYLKRRYLLKAGVYSIAAIGTIFCCGLFLLLALNIHTYHRLTFEVPVAIITTTLIKPQQFRVMVKLLPENKTTDYFLQGDEWQLDARILRWTPSLQLLGLDTLYRLERLSGRYRQIDDELNRSRTVYTLSNRQGLDIFSLAQNYQQWLGWLDAYYGNAAYLPMYDGARYIVSINQYGLIARPDNEIAKKTLHNWW
jgi:hypothetical protein